MEYILFPDLDYSAIKTFGGGKAANLAASTGCKGVSIPPWFCLSTSAFELFLTENAIRVAESSDEAQVTDSFLNAHFPASLKKELESALNKAQISSSFVAVRSSGIEEDSSDNSFAGQFSSFLFQRGIDNIIRSIKLCWASSYSDRAISYRKQRGIGTQQIGVGVVIQEMIDAEVSGVVFSKNPTRALNRDTVVISSVWGLGEGLVSGELDADVYEHDLRTGLNTKKLANKTHAIRCNPSGGISKAALAPELVSASSLTDEHAKQITGMAVQLEKHFGFPQDCEWAIRKGKLFLLQSRPITTLPPNAFFDPNVIGATPTLWDNSNIIESYSGVTSPLTFTFARAAYEQVYFQFCEVMGVPAKLIDAYASVFRNMLGLVRGRVYYNLINWYKLVLLLPGSSSNKGFMETMMGVKQSLSSTLQNKQDELFGFLKNPPHYSPLKKLIVYVVTIWRFIRIEQIITTFSKNFEKVYQETRKLNPRNLSLTDQINLYFNLYDKLLKRWQAPIINDYLCMLFFGLLKKLTASWLKDQKAESLQNDLLCGQGDLESTQPTKTLMRIAQAIDKDNPKERDHFLSLQPSEILAAVKAGRFVDFNKGLQEFLDKYGFRCVNELKLEEPDLYDDPAFIIAAVQSYVRTKAYSIDAMEKRELEIRESAEALVRTKLSGFRKIIFFWVLKQARSAVRTRENLRFARTKIFGIVRHLFRAMGANLVALKVLEEEKDIFLLTLDELFSFIEGRNPSIEFKPLVASRKIEFERYRKERALPGRFLTIGAAGASFRHPQIIAEMDLLSESGQSADPSTLSGTPCCPGIVEGAVKVVTTLDDARDLDGSILVTERTDPGWVPLYPSCAGLLIERGSLLSHSAVVARELGLPTIVGISGGLMTKLKTGMRVRMDGAKGEVKILG